MKHFPIRITFVVAVLLTTLSLAAGAQSSPKVGATATYVWDQSLDSEPIYMGSTKEWFCGIKSVRGQFNGEKERVLIAEDSTGNWYLSGASNKKKVRIEALCFPHRSSVLSVYKWNQGQDRVLLGSVARRYCALTSISGNFAGRGEAVRVYAENGSWYLSGQSKKKGVSGQAACTDIEENTPVKFFDWTQGQPSEEAGSAATSICMLTSMTGEFAGDEAIMLGWAGGLWTLGGNAKRDTTHIGTSAACISLNR